MFAHFIGNHALPRYANWYSPKKFTQPQLFACLVLKEFMRLDYRKLSALLSDAPNLCEAIHLKTVPHYTTFQKAAARLLISSHTQRALHWTLHVGIALKKIRKRVALAALDGTGFESHHASRYYVQRRSSTSKYWQKTIYRTFPKAGIVCDCASHMVLAIIPEQGPGPDIRHFRKAVDEAQRIVRLETLVADAGYDSEQSHEYGRNQCGIRTLIPPLIGRPTNKPPSGYWRRQMKVTVRSARPCGPGYATGRTNLPGSGVFGNGTLESGGGEVARTNWALETIQAHSDRVLSARTSLAALVLSMAQAAERRERKGSRTAAVRRTAVSRLVHDAGGADHFTQWSGCHVAGLDLDRTDDGCRSRCND